MRRRRIREEEALSFPITPMIDMVFLLLIFFMVTSRITQESRKKEIRLPETSIAQKPISQESRELLNLDEKGVIFIGETATPEPELKKYLMQRLKDHPPLRIYVRADAQTPAATIKRIVRICAETGAIDIGFGAYCKSPPP